MADYILGDVTEAKENTDVDQLSFRQNYGICSQNFI